MRRTYLNFDLCHKFSPVYFLKFLLPQIMVGFHPFIQKNKKGFWNVIGILFQ